MEIRFEPFKESHRSDIVRIYNYYIETGTSAFVDSAVSEDFTRPSSTVPTDTPGTLSSTARQTGSSASVC